MDQGPREIILKGCEKADPFAPNSLGMPKEDLHFQPAIYIQSNHPLVLHTIERILGPVRYQVKPFSKLRISPIEEQSWILIVDTCSVQDWFENIIQCQLKSGRSILLVPTSLHIHEEEIRLIYAGVHGIVPMVNLEIELARAVDCIKGGDLWFCRTTLHEYVKRTQPTRRSDGTATCTIREEQIIGLLQAGFANKEISNMLGISGRTVKFHVSNILRKFKVTNRKALLLKVQRSSEPVVTQSLQKAAG